MKTTKIKMVLGVLAVCLAFNAMADDSSINSVTIRQRWPWSRLVDIDYVLVGDSTQRVDVQINAFDGDTQLTLPTESLTGDIYGVTRGPRHIVWDPTATAYTNSGVLTKFRVALAQTNVPLYMIVDLTSAAAPDEYVYEEALTNGLWGAWERDFVQGVESVIWTGVTTNETYKTDKLVLRRIPAGTFTMGSPGTESYRWPREDLHSVTFTKDFYVGVFEVTQKQWYHVMNDNPSEFNGDTRPVESLSYNTIRGATNNVPTVNWPATHSFVASSSFLGKLREKTGIDDFDLPTDAQWEYVCRAETTGALNDGTVNITNVNSDANLDLLGRYKGNDGLINKTALVGSYAPNAWGLYDMHGNVWEWCRDWYMQNVGTAAVTDPPGPGTSTTDQRVAHGGAFDQNADLCRSAFRSRNAPVNGYNSYGLRVVRTLP